MNGQGSKAHKARATLPEEGRGKRDGRVPSRLSSSMSKEVVWTMDHIGRVDWGPVPSSPPEG